ncbi:galactokinase family protein [Nesterenkonia lacusekhoensis]|uniref:Galactokinase n=1 Tax=Nesterenkonia lacusekhoensis TaxID=150832 RepID=A0ABS4T3Q0_9MICC|nr:galactokinase family protein [Nesterenkonia lacusekhoensis]MBP2318503.1 galactokinase [Nesterenkonia lacusekhoensis]
MAEKMTQGTWAAPGRVNLMGEHTDYNGGFVLPFALSQTTTVAAAVRDDRRVTVRSSRDDTDQSDTDQSGAAVEFSLDGLAPGEVDGWAAYVAGTLWALEQAGYRVPGLDLQVDSTVPV